VCRRSTFIQGDEALRTGKPQRSNEHRIDDAEGGGVDADAEPKCEDDHEAKAVVASQRPECVVEIVQEARHGGLDEKRSRRVVRLEAAAAPLYAEETLTIGIAFPMKRFRA